MENKTSKYLLYAIGEIILVVIGILIALFINNKNLESANELKITNILKEVQADILTNIKNSYNIFDYQIYTDSISKLILNDTYTVEDYRLNKYRTLGYNYNNFDITTNGFDNLKSNFDKIPEKYKHLMPEIKELHIKIKSTIDDYNNRLRETVYRNVDNNMNFDWYQDMLKNKLSDAEMNYRLYDIQYKNMVANYMNYRRNLFNVSNDYRQKATSIYHAIAKAIGDNDTIPDLLKKKALDLEFINNFTGNYERTENTTIGAKRIEIKIIDGELFLISKDDSREFKLESRDKRIFYTYSSPKLIVVLNNPQKPQVYISIRSGNVYGVYNRTLTE